VHYLIHHGRVQRSRIHHYYLASAHPGYETVGRRHHEYYGYRRATDYHYRHVRYWTHYRHSGLQCVPYAREVSHIDLSGDAFLWWAEASGRYARGDVPEEGAVLNFRGIGRMPLGHVAVVTSVIDSRTILVTQANWVRGTITNDVQMQDVSPNNDWTQVQVELGDSSTWGAAYPTYGFIYNRPATSTIIAASGQGNEVAEAPSAAAISFDAPNRNLQ
jgi:surface antigen